MQIVKFQCLMWSLSLFNIVCKYILAWCLYIPPKRLENFLFTVSLYGAVTLAVWSMAWEECIAALVLDHAVEQTMVCLCSFLLADVSVRVVSDSCAFIMHFLSVCCSSSAATQECLALPDLLPICLMKRLLISSGQTWPCNQPSPLLPLFHSASPAWSHFRGITPTLLGIMWSSFLAWVGTDFSWLSQNDLATILSQVIYLCNCVL